MKLKAIKLANAIRCGSSEETYFTDATTDIEMTGPFTIKLTDRGRYGRASKMSTAYTTLFNTVYWYADQEEETPARKQRSKVNS